MIPILETATADRVGDDGRIRARPPPRSLKSAMKASEVSAQTSGGAAAPGDQVVTDLNATDSDDDADEDGEALGSGMAMVAMPDGADEAFFGADDGASGSAAFSQWDEEWEETFFDGASASLSRQSIRLIFRLLGRFSGGGALIP